MLVRVSNDKTSFTVNDFDSLEEAKECFPNYEVIACNDIIDFTSYKKYVQSIITKLPSRMSSINEFTSEIRKINPAITIYIEEGDYTIGVYSIIDIRLLDHNRTRLYMNGIKIMNLTIFILVSLLKKILISIRRYFYEFIRTN